MLLHQKNRSHEYDDGFFIDTIKNSIFRHRILFPMKRLFFLSLFFLNSLGWSQNGSFSEKPPVFSECKNESLDNMKLCFDQQLYNYIASNFQMPEDIDGNFVGDLVVLFEVDKKGEFKVLYVDAVYDSLKDEVKRVFGELPQIEPGTYNGLPAFNQYSVTVRLPFGSQKPITNEVQEVGVPSAKASKQDRPLTILEKNAKTEFDSVKKGVKPYEYLEYGSQLNIPFTHSSYARFDRNMNLIGTNSHTASKPFMYDEVDNYYDFKAAKDALKKETSTWAGRKLWNEHLVAQQGKDYWFTIDPIFDFEVGKDFDADFSSTFNNTRGIYVLGGLGKKLNFFTAVYESQGRWAQYFNQYAESIKGADEAAVVPGRGIAKRFKDDAYDYPVAEAYLSYTPAKFLNVQFGHGKNFIGDGYRSLFISDVASPHPFLKLNTKFWKIKYTSTWTWLRDIRPEVEEDGAYLPKYMATHFLSWNVSKRLNIGLFESIIWSDTNNRGFDINYINPIIFFRAIEFETGQGAGNALLGLATKYKVSDNINVYGQFILDEFSLSDIKGGEKSWKNKFGYQLGIKYFDAFKVRDLMLQAEYNRVRPYTYSHNTIVHNYGHANQSMAHLWGANFSEFILIGRYNYKRWQGEAKLVMGTRGFDYNNSTDAFSYGGDIYRNYNDRPFDTGVEVGQGIKTTSLNAEVQAAYLVNPVTNLKFFAGLSFRNFNPNATTVSTFESNTTWLNVGVRTDLFNWYFDF